MPGSALRYVGETPTLLRRQDQSASTVALLEPDNGEVAFQFVDRDTLHMRKVSTLSAVGPIFVGLLTVLMILSCLLFLPIWGIRAAFGKLAIRENLGLRLWPLAASASIVWFVASFFAMMADFKFYYQDSGYVTVGLPGVLLLSASLCALIVPWLGMAMVVRGMAGAHRGLVWHAALVLLSTGVLGLCLLSFGSIPFVSWA
jgi:hypothetical protein